MCFLITFKGIEMKRIIFATSILMAISSLHTATALPTKPSNCPDVKVIKNIKFDTVNKDNVYTGKWYAENWVDSLGTDRSWSFIMTNISAMEEPEAWSKAYKGLKSMEFASGPYVSSADEWVCMYENAEGYDSYAITPSLKSVMF